MKANELFEQIHCGKIKEDTQIDVINELTGQYITTIEFRNGMLNWEPGEFDTSFLCNIDIDFVVKENKGIEELNDTNYDENLTAKRIYHNFTRSKLNEVIRAVNKINKDLEKAQTLNIEIDEETINNSIKRARNYLEREEK